jgi:hypothetical protein
MHIPLPTSSLAPVSKSNKVVTVMYYWTRVYLMDERSPLVTTEAPMYSASVFIQRKD